MDMLTKIGTLNCIDIKSLDDPVKYCSKFQSLVTIFLPKSFQLIQCLQDRNQTQPKNIRKAFWHLLVSSYDINQFVHQERSKMMSEMKPWPWQLHLYGLNIFSELISFQCHFILKINFNVWSHHISWIIDLFFTGIFYLCFE